MYNRYQNGTEPWWAMKEALEVHKDLQERVDAVEDTFESIIDQLDTAIADREEMEEERDQAQTDLDELQTKFEAFEPEEIIKLLDSVESATSAVVKYCVQTRMKVREAYNVQESDSDSSDGAAGDGGS